MKHQWLGWTWVGHADSWGAMYPLWAILMVLTGLGCLLLCRDILYVWQRSRTIIEDKQLAYQFRTYGRWILLFMALCGINRIVSGAVGYWLPFELLTLIVVFLVMCVGLLTRKKARVTTLRTLIAFADDYASTRAASEVTTALEKKVSFILNHLPAIYWEVNKDGILIECEGNHLQNLGVYYPNDLIGESVFSLAETEDSKRRLRSVLSGAETHMTYDSTFNGRTFTNVISRVVDNNGVLKVIGLIYDTTEETLVRQDLETRARRLEELIRQIEMQNSDNLRAITDTVRQRVVSSIQSGSNENVSGR